MICKISGCGKSAKFKTEQLCQMHYFRRMRNGTFDTIRKKGREKYISDNGYVMVHCKGHHFAREKTHYAFEHRIVAYEKYGEILPNCELCDMELNWSNAVIDHIDEVRTNNHPNNLRPLCWNCNINRTVRVGLSYRNAMAVEFNGRTMTPTEWAREPNVKVHGATIRKRLKDGYSVEEAIFGIKKTHNGNIPIKSIALPKHTRRNAINITIDGELKTSMEWSRDKRCEVSDGTLRNRVKSGFPHAIEILKKAKRQEKRAVWF